MLAYEQLQRRRGAELQPRFQLIRVFPATVWTELRSTTHPPNASVMEAGMSSAELAEKL